MPLINNYFNLFILTYIIYITCTSTTVDIYDVKMIQIFVFYHVDKYIKYK